MGAGVHRFENERIAQLRLLRRACVLFGMGITLVAVRIRVLEVAYVGDGLLLVVAAWASIAIYMARNQGHRRIVRDKTSGRCERCGFDMRGKSGTECPECGQLYVDEAW